MNVFWLIGLIAAGSVLIALGRFTVSGHGLSWPGTYEALAHLWCGFLVGVGCFAQKDQGVRWWAWAALAIISALELVAFLVR